MSSTPKQHPVIQRLNRAYVQVPPSPLLLSARRVSGSALHVAASNKLKENTPLRPLQTSMAQYSPPSTSLKRKLSDREPGSLIFDGVVMPLKKSKLSPSDNGASSNKGVEPPNEIDSEFPNGFAYCHQCNKKRDIDATIVCTVVAPHSTSSGKVKEKSCRSKYCKNCLKNRYNEDLEAANFQSSQSGFKCPRCRNICNCPKCRKLKGLEPVGVIGNPWAKLLSKDPKPAPKPKEKAKPKVKEPDVVHIQQLSKVKQRDLPKIDSRPVPVNLNRDEVDERILIREFLFRFGDFMEPPIAKTHLEELELISGRPRRHEDENDQTTGWVSDACVKALILGLLGLLAKDNEDEVGRIIKGAFKDIRSAGVNLNKFWVIMASMRDEVANLSSSDSGSESSMVEIPLTFPDPAPPPVAAIANARSLRGTHHPDHLVNVVQSSQMIPVFLSLIHTSLKSAIIRDEIEQGLKDNRDVTRDAREATRLENERWEQERKSMENAAKDKALKLENRAKRAAHKEQMLNIENALKIMASSFAPRFTPLGTDDDGRIYYALSPGVAEREAALEYLVVASSEKQAKLKKKGRVLTMEERGDMQEWSWFVAVWGKPYPKAGRTDNSDEDGDESKWYGFYEPEEINRLAEWISVKSSLEDEGNPQVPRPRMEHLKRLVTELKDYATLLDWRARDDKYTLVKRSAQANEAT